MKKSRPDPIIKRTGQKARSLNKFKPNILSLNYSAAGAGVSVAGASVAGADSAGAVASV